MVGSKHQACIYVQLAGNVVLLIFGSICFRPLHYYVYRQSHVFQENELFAFSEPIEIKVGLLFENVLTGCNVTETKCSRIT